MRPWSSSSRSGGGGIRLGSEIYNLAEASRTKMAENLRPIMKAISEATGETVDLAVLEGDWDCEELAADGRPLPINASR